MGCVSVRVGARGVAASTNKDFFTNCLGLLYLGLPYKSPKGREMAIRAVYAVLALVFLVIIGIGVMYFVINQGHFQAPVGGFRIGQYVFATGFEVSNCGIDGGNCDLIAYRVEFFP
jgi:hypothetical protein